MQIGSFEVTRDEERLLLASPVGTGQLLTGCLLLGIAFFSVLALGGLSLLHESHLAGENVAPGGTGGFGPHGNHFGLLWLAGLVLAILLVPFTIARLYDGEPVYAFNRTSGEFRHGKRFVTRLGRIEAVCVRRITPVEEQGERPLYQLLVLYGDGFEIALKESHFDEPLEALAEEIARFVDREVVRQVPLPGALEQR